MEAVLKTTKVGSGEPALQGIKFEVMLRPSIPMVKVYLRHQRSLIAQHMNDMLVLQDIQLRYQDVLKLDPAVKLDALLLWLKKKRIERMLEEIDVIFCRIAPQGCSIDRKLTKLEEVILKIRVTQIAGAGAGEPVR